LFRRLRGRENIGQSRLIQLRAKILKVGDRLFQLGNHVGLFSASPADEHHALGEDFDSKVHELNNSSSERQRSQGIVLLTKRCGSRTGWSLKEAW
jgi:hypothetical protein